MSQNEILNSKKQTVSGNGRVRLARQLSLSNFSLLCAIQFLTATVATSAMAGAWQYKAPFESARSNEARTSGPSGSYGGLFNSTAAAPIPYVYKPNYPVQKNSWLPMAMVGLAALPMLFQDEPAPGSAAAARSKYQLAKDSPSGNRKTSRRAPANIPLRSKYKQKFLSEDQFNQGTAR